MTHKNRNTLIIGPIVGIILLAACYIILRSAKLELRLPKLIIIKLFCFSCLSFRLFFAFFALAIITSRSSKPWNL